ncbi:oxidoreductase [Teratosphaeria destructans]|uniref:Oxidoreductase n=1 Tax=Teratosphaeria destructans TaxID=418781 RepID=A0A9W7SVS7_9PEZI|nr:oxidoreductase [Teratosphaeria destructans]
MSSNQAAYLDGKDKKLRVGDATMPKPEAEEIVVKNHAVAVNPVDWKIQDYGMFVKEFPFVLGCDIAGEVVDVGSSVKRFKKGDRVLSHVVSLASQDNRHGGFQLYTAADSNKTAILPASLSYAEGSVLPLAVDTAQVGLTGFDGQGLGLGLPSLDPKSSGKVVVVYGASSSVGVVATQLASAAGAKVVAIASSHNHSFVKSAGAVDAYDYKDAKVVDDVVAAVKKHGGTFAGVYDAISTADSYKITVPVLEKLGGGPLSTVLPGPENPPSSVKVFNIFGINPLTHPVWSEYVTPALEAGKLRAIPEPLIVGKGLEAVQKGLDENKKGVSAKKVVVEL